MDKQAALDALRAEIAEDAALPLRSANLVFGEGSPDTTVLFIGEAPGQKEDELGRPFVGRAGQLLNKLLEEIGWKREEVYITNVVKRRPPENRDPFPEEIAAYTPYLNRQIEILDAPIIAPLGRFSMNFFLPEGRISRDQGKVFRAHGRFIVPFFHPAAALRSPAMSEALREAFHKLPKIVEACKNYVPPQPGTGGEEQAPPDDTLPRGLGKPRGGKRGALDKESGGQHSLF
jgi:uracil-DNA glycosylase family 4